jgi:hypothetical protein
MRSLNLFTAVCLSALTLGFASTAAAAETATGTVAVTAVFSSRTSLKVSTELLRFDVAGAGEVATAAVDFSAGARTVAGNEVMLSVESVRGLDGAAPGAPLSFAGIGAGTLAGPMGPEGLTVAGRWAGSGLRTGRLVFSVNPTASGSYTLPIRFVLTAP